MLSLMVFAVSLLYVEHITRLNVTKEATLWGPRIKLKEALKEVDTDQLTVYLAVKRCDLWCVGTTDKDSQKHPLFHTITLFREA